MNEDVIRFEVETKLNIHYNMDEDYEDEKYLTSVYMYINEVMINGYYIDGHQISITKKARDCYYSNWLEDMLYPQHEFSMFYPITCSCGVGGCAGLWDGVYMKVRKHSVEWRIKADTGYDFLPKRFFSFNREHYFAQVDLLTEQLHNSKEGMHVH